MNRSFGQVVSDAMEQVVRQPPQDVVVRILLRDTQTGETAWVETREQTLQGLVFYWTEGNNGCDCNRLRELAWALGREAPDDVDCSEGRVVIDAVTRDGEPWDWATWVDPQAW